VLSDLRTSAKNIEDWLADLTKPDKNSYGIIFDRAIASEQEFNSNVYGVKGKIDATIVLKNAH